MAKITAATALLAEHVGFPKTFQPWKNKFPREEIFFSSVGNFIFQRWKLCVPLLEPKSSSVGTEEFLRDFLVSGYLAEK